MSLIGKIAKGTLNVALSVIESQTNSTLYNRRESGMISSEEYRRERTDKLNQINDIRDRVNRK
jgi:hypothetical protein